ncbi:MAG: flippase-like domain-containing protein [Hymenobacteraceae bacterium]|nr:flippase-like domain-containing protein [Hymenobacteraceae bacterium]
MRHLLQKYASRERLPAPAGARASTGGARRWLGYLAKALILGLTLAALYEAVLGAPTVGAAWRALVARTLTNGSARWLLGAAVMLVPLNWGLEARKWQALARRVEPLGFGAAGRAVLLGLTLGFSTPNRVGDYAARVLLLRSRRRLDALGSVFLGRFAQLVVTAGAGSVGAGYFLISHHLRGFPLVQAGAAVGLVAVNVALLTALFFGGRVAAALALVPSARRWPVVGRWTRAAAILGAYSGRELAAVLGWSAARYVVFASQFGLLLAAFGVRTGVGEGALAVTGTFLLKSLVPSLSALTDIGARELSAVHFFGLLGQPALPVLSASLCLWLLNIALPSAAGLVLVPRLRLWLGRSPLVRLTHRPHGRQVAGRPESRL